MTPLPPSLPVVVAVPPLNGAGCPFFYLMSGFAVHNLLELAGTARLFLTIPNLPGNKGTDLLVEINSEVSTDVLETF